MKYLIFVIATVLSYYPVNSAFELNPRIVKGYEAQPGQFKYFAFLALENTNGDYYSCGASLINAGWLITAAHCLHDAQWAVVHLGRNNLVSYDEPGYISITVERENFHIHPFHVLHVSWNDIALIELPSEIRFSPYVQPIQMPTTCKVPENEPVYAMGHGVGDYGDDISRQLQYATLRTVPVKECRRAHPFLFWRKSVICAIDDAKYQSICDGDSGGGLVTKDGTLIGVAAFVKRSKENPELCDPTTAQAFTNIISYMSWIKEVTDMDLPDC